MPASKKPLLRLTLSIVLVTWTVVAIAQPSAPASTGVAGDRAAHPMDALTGDEIEAAAEILRASNRVDESAEFVTLMLAENDKSEVRAWRPGQVFERRAFAVIKQGSSLFEADVSLADRTIESWREIPDKQPRVLLSEVDTLPTLRASPEWREAMAVRGFEPEDEIFCAPLTAGPNAPPDRRVLNVSCYDVAGEDGMLFGRPIEGLMAVVDVDANEVLTVVDLGVVPMPPDSPSLSYERSTRYRSTSEPVEIVTPKGSNVRIDGSMIRWDNWEFHLRVDQRVGPILSLVRYDDQGVKRDVLYQLAVSELYVPYMDPAPTWAFKAYMDVGEYGFGLLASRLKPGTDCPTSAHYIDRTIADDAGRPMVLPNAVCMFERPTGGPLWRHVGDGGSESRESIELVVRMAPVVGNYDYIVDYVFSRAGDIDVRVGAAGIDAVKAVAARSLGDPTAPEDTAYGTLIGPGLVGINHDHYISFRVDMDVDGTLNRAVFDEVTPQALPRSGPRRSIWTVEPVTLDEEGPLPFELADGFLRIESEETNALGYRTSYQLYPGHGTSSVLSANDPIQRRAEWSRRPVWLSSHAPEELYASGAYPNQNDEEDGLVAWTRGRQPIDGEDLVLWYNVGFRHITRAEDWPAMPTLWHSFRLRPFNFFDGSPAMDVPP
jgi:primary-amine oxidase